MPAAVRFVIAAIADRIQGRVKNPDGVKRALKDDVEVVVLERQPWTSYSACGIPYWIAGHLDSPDGLIARTPEQHRANGLDLRTGWEATAIDPTARTVDELKKLNLPSGVDITIRI